MSPGRYASVSKVGSVMNRTSSRALAKASGRWKRSKRRRQSLLMPPSGGFDDRVAGCIPMLGSTSSSRARRKSPSADRDRPAAGAGRTTIAGNAEHADHGGVSMAQFVLGELVLA